MKLKLILIGLGLVLGAVYLSACCGSTKCSTPHHKHSFYEHSATSIDGKEISMEEYKGKVVLVVNTASNCGFTSQYEGLQELYSKYKDKGLVILGFPCNQFAGQEPGTNEEIVQFCQKNYGVEFPMFSKIDVNGEYTHPLYIYLKDEKSGVGGKSIKWNFTKFLVDREGHVVERFGTAKTPESIEKNILELLN